MKIYLVGGAVRDKLLGLPVKERDWVVVGTTPAHLLALGFKQVGKEFPVFLHPKTNEEYALARMERKVQPGYTGFTFDTSPHVSLEDDLIRRDLTINAMAEAENGTLIDPYQGKQDLDRKILRHVSPAFAEDPVRILRVGRFYARYSYLGFHIAPETITLMRQMVSAGEVNALVSERVWKELERALGEKNPEKFFEVLAECQALPILFPQHPINGEGISTLKAAAALSSIPEVRFAAFMLTLPDTPSLLDYIKNIGNRYRIPNAYKELAQLAARYCASALKAKNFSAHELLSLLNGLDVFRREKRFHLFLVACEAVAITKQLSFDADWLSECAEIARKCDIRSLVTQGWEGQQLAEKIRDIREEAISRWLEKS